MIEPNKLYRMAQDEFERGTSPDVSAADLAHDGVVAILEDGLECPLAASQEQRLIARSRIRRNAKRTRRRPERGGDEDKRLNSEIDEDHDVIGRAVWLSRKASLLWQIKRALRQMEARPETIYRQQAAALRLRYLQQNPMGNSQIATKLNITENEADQMLKTGTENLGRWIRGEELPQVRSTKSTDEHGLMFICHDKQGTLIHDIHALA